MQSEREIVLEVVSQLSSQLSPSYPTPTLTSELEVDLGIGSLERLELISRLEQRLGRKMDEQKAFQARQVSDLLAAELAQNQSGRTHVAGRIVPPDTKRARSWVEALLYQAENQPDNVAIVLLKGGKEVATPTYSDLVAQARRVAAGLLAQGVKPGDRVAIMLPTEIDFFAALYGTLWMGAVPVPLYPPVRLDQAQDFIARQDAILANSGARILISLPQLAPMAELLKSRSSVKGVSSVKALSEFGAAPLGPRGHLGLIQYTSGSTGQPKGVALSHENLLANTWALGEEYGFRSGEVMVSWLPLYHDMGLIGTSMGSLTYGMPVVLMGPEQFLARPALWIQAFSDYRGTCTAAPNFAYGLAARKITDAELQGVDLSPWRVALNGAEPIQAETARAFVDRFQPYGFRPGSMYPAYGLAEATLAVTLNPQGRGILTKSVDLKALQTDDRVQSGSDTLVSSGRVIQNVEVRIASSTGDALPDGVQGRVLLRGPAVMTGYFGRPPRGEAWHDSGDLGFFEAGELYITGRSQDLIIVGGRNLHPHDLEATVSAVAGVRPGCVAAFGVEEAGTQSLVVLAEARKPGESLERQIQTALQAHAGLLAKIVVLPPRTLPKTPSGKIRRQESRRRFLAGELKPPALSLRWLGKATLAWLRSRIPSARALWVLGWTAVCWCDLILRKQPLQSSVRQLLKRLGIEWRVQGNSRLSGPLCLVSNHASLLDPLLLIAAWEGQPLRFVVSDVAGKHPLLKYLTRPHLAIRRGQTDANQSLAQFTQALDQGDCLVVFPEGGIEAAAGVRSFATGAFQACCATDTYVLPAAIQGSRKILPQGHWIPARGKVEIHFASVLAPQGVGFEDAVALASASRSVVADALGEPFVESRLARQD